jgi:hypothetical protein
MKKLYILSLLLGISTNVFADAIDESVKLFMPKFQKCVVGHYTLADRSYDIAGFKDNKCIITITLPDIVRHCAYTQADLDIIIKSVNADFANKPITKANAPQDSDAVVKAMSACDDLSMPF